MTYYCERCLSEHESPDFVCAECEPGSLSTATLTIAVDGRRLTVEVYHVDERGIAEGVVDELADAAKRAIRQAAGERTELEEIR